MNYFYFKEISEGYITLDEDESKHLQQVLRQKSGNLVHLLNGNGLKAEGYIFSSNKKTVSVKLEKTDFIPKKKYRLHLAIGPTKQMERFEWFLEKATEIGIDEITPVLSIHGERSTLRMDRLEKIIRTAGKQSGNPYFPVLNGLTLFQDLIKNAKEKHRFIAHIDHTTKNHLFDVIPSETDCLVLIGPEGDFDEKEVQFAKNHHFMSVHLGENRLRTETAGIFAAQCLILRNKI
ncbi:MAG: RsmE family RNA methyltransferase [Bacteroidota bacterium]